MSDRAMDITRCVCARAGARAVIGIDPTTLYVLQFLAVQKFKKVPNVFVLPLRLDELPQNARKFDTTFSMGVLYHQRSPLDHLRELRATLRQGGQLVLGKPSTCPGEEIVLRARRPIVTRECAMSWLLADNC